MPDTLHDKICATLNQRLTKENQWRMYYMMVHDGLPRRNQPFPNASQQHFPLCDGAVSKLKPFFIGQIFQGERLAEFTSWNRDLLAFCEAAADCFSWEVRERSNFAYKLQVATYHMLVYARGVLKAGWDPIHDRLKFAAMDMPYFIVPANCDDLDDPECDWFVEVEHISVGTYERSPYNFDQNPKLIKEIRGRQDYKQTQIEQEILLREGLTYSVQDDQIVLWHVWEQIKGGWLVHTYSPQKPGVQLRPDFQCPYKMQGRAFQPYTSFQYEIKDEGWYSPRGVVEKLAPFEASATKVWDMQMDSIEFVGKPLFSSDDPVPPNMANLTFRPGSVLPNGLKPVQMPEVPKDLAEQFNQNKVVAEQYLGMPDAGMQPDPSMGERGKGGVPTATQVNYESGLTNVRIGMDGTNFRSRIGTVMQKAWAILIAHKKEAVMYRLGNAVKELPQQALSDMYTVTPSGSADSWSKPLRIQRAMQRYQVFAQDPAVDHDQLVKDVLAADDPRLLQTLFIGTKAGEQNAVQKTAVDMLLCQTGFQPQVLPGDNHQIAVETAIRYVQAEQHKGNPLTPEAHTAIFTYIGQHMAFLQQQNPKAFTQLQQILKQLSQAGMPPNAVQMPPQGQPQQPAQGASPAQLMAGGGQ